MIERKLNRDSIEFLKKILLFADSVLINAISSNPEETDRILSSGLLGIKDAIQAEISTDLFVERLNQATQEKNKKKEQEDLNQEKK